MDSKIPLGEREGQTLEFKATESLKRPFSISREVVAMLNAGGGEIWIGLRDENDIAVEVQGIPEAERAKVDLLNHLIEVVEPRLQGGDVVIDILRSDTGSVLRLRIAERTERRPFAQLKDGGRYYLTRIDHRLRPMSREEILGETAPGDQRIPIGVLRKHREHALELCRPGLWVGVVPQPELQLDAQAETLEELLLDPTKSGNRLSGWNFRYPRITGNRPIPIGGGIEYGEEEYRKTTIHERGFVESWTTLAGLHHGTDQAKEIYPLALLEYPTSIMRLAARIYEVLGDRVPECVLVDAALIRADGWRLPTYPPGTYGHRFEHESPRDLEDGQFLLPAPFRFEWNGFREQPDHAAYMLVRSIYQAFHLREERIPREYDRTNSRLTLSD